jgi:sorbitol-specific phosphotransferase system component IIBC
VESAINIVLHAGRSAVDVALYTLRPIMVVMMIVMRLLEACGVLDKPMTWLAPVARPFGLTGLSVLAMIQISAPASCQNRNTRLKSTRDSTYL